MPKAPAPAPAFVSLPLHQIHPNPDQPRRTIEDLPLQELAASIARVGLIQPIAVRPAGDGYQIVSGERRWRAFGLLAEQNPAFASIPAVIQPRDDADTQLAALVENILRQDLNPIERADALHALRKALRTNWGGVARQTGVGERRIKQMAGLTTVRREVRQAAETGGLGEGHLRAVHLLGNSDGALQLLDYLREQPTLPGEAALDLARVMKRHPGLSPQAAAGLRQAGHPAVELPPLPPPLDQSTAGRAVALAKGLIKLFDDLDDDAHPGEAGEEVLHLIDVLAARATVLRVTWRRRPSAE